MIKSKSTLGLGVSLDDPLLHRFEFPFESIFHPLGFAVRLRTNRAEVIDAARESFGPFRDEFHTEPMEIQFAIYGPDDAPFPPAPVFRSQRHLLTITTDANNFGFFGYQLYFLEDDKIVFFDLYTEKIRLEPVGVGEFVLVSDERILLVTKNGRAVLFEYKTKEEHDKQ